MAEFDGKVAIVTGAGRLRGIGRTASVALAALSYRDYRLMWTTNISAGAANL
jgi:NAD(P)-dependent dehydrogenase (short-subunit alcohol dehydrogenase family)